MKHINSPPSSRAIFLLISQNVCNCSNPCCSLWAAGHCGHGAACRVLLCKWKLVLPYTGVLSLNCSWFQLSQAGWESPNSHEGTLDSHGSTGARGGGTAAVGSSFGKARSCNISFCRVYNCSYLTADAALFPCSPSSAGQAQHLAGPWDPVQTCTWHCLGVSSHIRSILHIQVQTGTWKCSGHCAYSGLGVQLLSTGCCQ